MKHHDDSHRTIGPPHRRGVSVDLLPLVRPVGEVLGDLDLTRLVDARLRRVDLGRLSGNLAVELWLSAKVPFSPQNQARSEYET